MIELKKKLKDCNNGRDRWLNRIVFILAAVGSCIGMGNMWKFPFLTFKHGGVTFIVAYIVGLIIVGLPMLILELTLGQKMQRGSAGALRGITPRLAGAGWVSSFAGFILSIIYSVFLALSMYFLFVSGSEPWKKQTIYESCLAADKEGIPQPELYLYLEVLNFLTPRTCEPFEDGVDKWIFNGDLFAFAAVSWVICFLCIVRGVKSSSWVVMVSVPLPFVLVIALCAHYMGLNNDVGGKGMDFYLGG